MEEKIKILLVEDDLSQVYLLKETLSAARFHITLIEDGMEAFHFLSSTPVMPDLVLLDYHLPGMDGLTLMARLKELGKSPNFIFLTADYSIETAIKSINAGALEFIPKDGRFIREISNIINKTIVNIQVKSEKDRVQKALAESEERLRLFMEASRDGILEWDIYTGVMSCNPACSQMLGYWPSDIEHQVDQWKKLIHPDDLTDYDESVEAQIQNHDGFGQSEFRARCKDNTYKWIYQRRILIFDKTKGFPARFIAVHSDISERKTIEEKVKHSESLYNTTINALNDLIVVVENNYMIVLANNSMTEKYKELNPHKNILGRNLSELFPLINENCAGHFRQTLLTNKETITQISIDKNEKTEFFEVKFSPIIKDGRVLRIVISYRDITEIKNHEKIILKTIIDTEEKERKRFSEDLHDDLGALLSTVKIYLNTISSETFETEQRTKMVNYTNELIDQAIETARNIANNLSPNIIKRFGLVQAIGAMFEKIRSANPIEINFNSQNFKAKLQENQEISVYRIVCELVNNTIKHSGAERIELKLESFDNQIMIQYHDNGRGFDFDKTITGKNQSGNGLNNIVTRVKSLNGKIALTSEQKGFAISIELNPN